VEQLCPGSKLEMFARTKREGWDSWGDELDKGR
jgi:N6-adenosine-specific RNA methylase IME4